MNIILLANAISLIASMIMISVGFIKTKKNILLAQCGQFFVFIIANAILKARAAVISNIIAIARNLVTLKYDLTKPLKVFFILLQVVMTLISGVHSLIDLLPLGSAIIFTLMLDSKDEKVIKSSIILAQLLWTIYDLYFLNYVSAVFDLGTVFSNAFGIYILWKEKRSS